MKVTYALTVCNEFVEIQRLINFLLKNKRIQDNIVVLYDSKNGDIEIENFLRSHSINGEFAWHKGEFNRHFADWKNKLTSFCTGDYIFQIDADELPNENLIAVLPDVIEENENIDVFLVPRVNTVEGLTPEHIQKWGWKVNDAGWVNWPDYQWRIWKNKPEIQWVNKVHERLDGFKMYTALPDVEYFALNHPKTISKQEKQNNLYNNL
jgi:hypothetical protein